MVLPGETIATGGSDTCDCGDKLELRVLQSPAGHYIGTQCDKECGPWSRESGYYNTRVEAETALKKGGYER